MGVIGTRERVMRFSVSLLVIAVVAPACVHPASVMDGASDASVVKVTGPVVVGFFPAIGATLNPDLTAADKSGLNFAKDHFTWALDNLRACLGSRGIQVREVYADEIIIENQGTVDRFALDQSSKESIGCYIVAPGRAPSIQRATLGTSSLILACQSLASVYFEIPECCPKGATCCGDGTYRSEGSPCDG